MSMTSPSKLFSYDRLVSGIVRSQKIAQPDAGFLAKIAAEILAERLNATNRNFDNVADIFSSFGCMQQPLEESEKTREVRYLNHPHAAVGTRNVEGCLEAIPFGRNTLNLVTSVFGLHWSNDLPGTMMQIHKALAPDGLLMAVLPGDNTLNELRQCLIEAETEITGAISLRIEPFGEVRQFGALLQRTGFTLPVVDTETFTVRYDSMFNLIDDLRAMGVSGNLAKKPTFGPRNLFHRASELYSERFSDPDGRIRATFEMVFLSGWTPHASQQKPLEPGSATKKLADFL